MAPSMSSDFPSASLGSGPSSDLRLRNLNSGSQQSAAVGSDRRPHTSSRGDRPLDTSALNPVPLPRQGHSRTRACLSPVGSTQRARRRCLANNANGRWIGITASCGVQGACAWPVRNFLAIRTISCKPKHYL